MHRVMFAVLLVPILALAAVNLHPITTIVVENDVATATAIPVEQVEPNREPGASVVIVGTVDTVGGTTYDWQSNGPCYRNLVNSTAYGIHALWMFSAMTSGTTFPDRNMRYNFYDNATTMWNWIDPDFMASGVNVYTERCGYGNLDIDPTTGVAMVSAHLGSPLRIDVARDLAPGTGIFEYCSGSPLTEGYQWGYISTGGADSTTVHCACIDGATSNGVYYARVPTWCTWQSPVGLAAPQPDPDFPNQNVGASKVSDKVCVTWEYSAGNPDPGFYRISTDGGENWGAATELPWPDAYGGDTLTSYHITSLFPFYDAADKLHIAAGVGPVVEGQGLIIPAQIWHWCADNSPNWSHIITATTDTLAANVGYNALYACRPTMGEDHNGNLFVVWEQFDSLNMEPGPPEVLRADIFIAGSGDDGVTWDAPVKLTDGGTVSHRFPTVIDMALGGADDCDTVAVLYMIDQKAAFFVQEQGPATNNPIIVHKVAVDEILGNAVAEPRVERTPLRAEMTARPNPFGNRTVISYVLPRTGDMSLTVHDAAGRPVRTLAAGARQAGRYTVALDGRAANGDEMAAGIYFYTLNADDTSLTEKLIVVY